MLTMVHIGLTINCLGVLEVAELTLTCNGCRLGQQGYLEGGGGLSKLGIINLLTKPP